MTAIRVGFTGPSAMPATGPDGRIVDRPAVERDQLGWTEGDPDADVFYDAAGSGWHLAPPKPEPGKA